MLWDLKRIKSILPHREPFLFIDEIVEINGTDRSLAVKHLLESEGYFEGHFPGKPVMPGVLIIEAMAQASIVLYSVSKPDIVSANPDYYIGKVKAEFLSPAYPGDKLLIETHKVKFLDYAGITDVEVKVEDRIVAKANLVFSIQQK